MTKRFPLVIGETRNGATLVDHDDTFCLSLVNGEYYLHLYVDNQCQTDSGHSNTRGISYHTGYSADAVVYVANPLPEDVARRNMELHKKASADLATFLAKPIND